MDRQHPPPEAGGMDASGRASNDFLLMTGQPGLLGLSDGSISTLAPLFAAALSTGSSRVALLVGLSAAIGAAISMAVSEALSDLRSLPITGLPDAMDSRACRKHLEQTFRSGGLDPRRLSEAGRA